jgi:hypothetical protein
MGMFDYIFLDVSCPVCGNAITKPFQTKNLDCFMDVYHTGDNIGTAKKLKSIRAYTTCDHIVDDIMMFTRESKELGSGTVRGVWIEYKIPIIDGIISQDQNLWTRMEIEDSSHGCIFVIPRGMTLGGAIVAYVERNRKFKRDILITKWEQTHIGKAPV